ncbi:MAG: sigma-70 family RNA polymerase sigma factor [Planctomycetota bacterium]|nr:sigma-70 family RNA polymerase sigma factor [Planctomycetota bacterium]MDA1213698.1 sigma-70 family RNA polymerase sigma factor [Planctomycetota bacterium]
MALTEIDRNLLHRCLHGESGAWKDFVDRFLGLFIHVIQHCAHTRSLRLNSPDIDDLCAEIFLTLLDKDSAVLRAFRGNSSLATYLTVIARRVVIREMAARKKYDTTVAAGNSIHAIPEAEEEMGEYSRIEDRETVRLMLDALPDADAEVVRQYHLEGRTYRQISEQLQIPMNTIGPILSRARSWLRQHQVRS